MALIYFPSCKFTAYSPESSARICSWLCEKHGAEIAGCCRPDHKKLGRGDKAVYICNTCAAICRESADAAEVVSVWELLAGDGAFPCPDYKRRKIAVQDCWRVYDSPSQQKAVRALLTRMNLDVVELEENLEKTRFCGTSLYEPLPEQNAQLAPRRFVENAAGLFRDYPEEERAARMREHCRSIPVDEVAVYCTSCAKGLDLGGKKGLHLLDLLFENI